MWLRTIGEDYITFALEKVSTVDPDAKLETHGQEYKRLMEIALDMGVEVFVT
jgi:hypothetical protein